MNYDNLLVREHEHTATITINRASVLNALNQKTLLELEQVLLEIKNQNRMRALIITGAGEKSFVAGADISEMKNLTPVEAKQFSVLGHRVFDLIGALDVPVIAAVNGFALGGGLELALACDFIYASENARFGLVETKLGLIPGFGGIARLTRRVGDAYAREMIFSALQIDAKEAWRIGLVNRLTPVKEVVSFAEQIAVEIKSKGPYAISLVKGLMREDQNVDIRTANAMEQHAFGLAFSHKEHDEGIQAFLEKRTASF